MTRSSKLLVLALLAVVRPAILRAQDDPHETPLGDVARNLRKRTPPSLPVIDDDNFSKVMEQAESQHEGNTSLHFLMPAENKGFQVSHTDVTCNLSFSANAKSLMSSQYAEMKLPANEVFKLQGPATIDGNALNVTVTNGTDWHLSEVAVAITVIKKSAIQNSISEYGESKVVPAPDPSQESVFRPVKRPDTTVIYRMRAAAAPSATTAFRAPLNLELAAGDEWHWAIVQAMGYPPQGYTANLPQLATEADPLAPSTLTVPSSLTQFDTSTAATLHRDPQ